ncbi:E3 ubiquitin-protein ligase RNF12-A-like [Pseudophryne corroboree]|uniref:E3 ubiquitin-protein ligase RNF12-A-like n=1 Tax=Pseudophryne corroboree TaxID=495146 RepID=UPI0030818148
MSRRELWRLQEDQRTWSRQGDHDESSQTVFEERLRSERRRGIRRSRPNTQEHPSSGETSPRLQRPRREHRHRSRSPLPTPPVATTDRPSSDPRPGPSSQQPAENEQNLPAMVIEINGQNLPAMMIEIDEQNLLDMVEEIYGFQMTTIAEDEAAQSCAICLMEYEEGEPVIVLSCSHRYHPSCISQWLATNLSCPVCHRECILRPVVCLIR